MRTANENFKYENWRGLGMYIENGNGVFRLPNRSWSGFGTSLLGKRSNKKNVVRYFGHFDVEDVEHSFYVAHLKAIFSTVRFFART